MISVIVPIYNVQSFLEKCLRSLLEQTIDDVEYILIDDGSTDRSGEIADSFSIVDTRFRVFHTTNKGLSAARNTGIEHSKGEWIMFVDGDDWVEPTFCEIPYMEAQKQNADIVIFQLYTVHRRRIEKFKLKAPLGIVSKNVAIEYGDNVAWNKLYRKTLFTSIRYPEEIMAYEDAATTYLLLYEAKKICVIDDYLYYHIDRRNSISNTSSLKNRRDGFIVHSVRYENLIKKGFPEEKLNNQKLAAAIGLVASNCPQDDEYYLKAKTMLDSTESIPKEMTFKKRIAIWLWKHNKALFYFSCKMTGRLRV